MTSNRQPASRPQARPGSGRRGRPNRPDAVAVILLVAALAAIVAGGLYMRGGAQWLAHFGYRPVGIVIHHSATDGIIDGKQVGAQLIDKWHASRGWGRKGAGQVYHIGYHYVILADGTVQPGRPEWMPGAHTRGHNNMLGICMVGNFEKQWPTRAQLAACAKLVAKLMNRYGFSAADVYAHRQFADTACPGRHVDVHEIARQAALHR